MNHPEIMKQIATTIFCMHGAQILVENEGPEPCAFFYSGEHGFVCTPLLAIIRMEILFSENE